MIRSIISYNKKLLVIYMGVILLVVRGGEFFFDILWGDGDGRMTRPLFLYSLNVVYGTITIFLIWILLTWNARMKRFGIKLISGFLIVYIGVFLVNVYIYYYGIPFSMDSTKKDLLVSFGVTRIESHPSYREYIKAFVKRPGSKKGGSPGDAYRAYGIPLDIRIDSDLMIDENGFPNRNALAKARILFVGDSFAWGSGSRTTIGEIFEALSTIPTYTMANSGFGLPHYLKLVEHFTSPLQESTNRFKGREVYILIYIGNDIGYDTEVYLRRSASLQTGTLIDLLQLSPLYNFFRMIKEAHMSQGLKLQGQNSSNSVSDYEELRKRYNGWYPNRVMLPHYIHEYFAIHPCHRQDFLDITWFDQPRQKYIQDIFEQFKLLQEERNLLIRFIVLPTKVQLIYQHLDCLKRPDKDLQAEQELPLIQRHQDLVTTFVVTQLQEKGFEVINMNPILQEKILTERIVWDRDTHYTEKGDFEVAKTIYQEFYNQSE